MRHKIFGTEIDIVIFPQLPTDNYSHPNRNIFSRNFFLFFAQKSLTILFIKLKKKLTNFNNIK
jgi:hypothetical protein